MKIDAEKVMAIDTAISLSNGDRVVLVEPPTDGSWIGEDVYLNIYRIDKDGEIVWRVLAPKPVNSSDAFVNLSGNELDISASRFFGAEFRIDVNSGVAEETGWHK